MPPPQAARPLLRVLACGSVDDGKSTLIGRLLHAAGAIEDDRMAELVAASGPGGIDYARLLDGLAAERSQGITIDVAWRQFATPTRRFMLADAPGHAQYTANMATAAAGADLAVLLVDARAGIQPQTRRHAAIAAMMGIRQVILAVNKMDLRDFSRDAFGAIAEAFAGVAGRLGIASVTAIPLCATTGDNVATRSSRMPWYDGPTLLAGLEQAEPAPRPAGDFRMPVQLVIRGGEARHYAGTVAAGHISRGERIAIQAAAAPGRTAVVTGIAGPGGATEHAAAGDAVTITLDAQHDIARGDVLAAGVLPAVTDRLEADIFWLGDAPLFPGRSHLLKLGAAIVPASLARIAWRRDVDTLSPVAFERGGADALARHDIARVSLALDAPIVAAPFAQGASQSNAGLGGFILIDRLTNATVGVGTVAATLPRAGGAVWQTTAVDRAARAAAKGQRPVVLWFTGLSGAGKSTIANLVEQRLHALGRHTAMLDGDNLRHGLCRDLGFSEADRIENIRRAAEAARLLADAGLIVLASFISPYRADRAAARALFGAGEFIEVFVDTPVAECRRRDPKGLYARADAGELRQFTGVDSPYEPPEAPELRLDAASIPAAELAARVVAYLER
jgi:bifunctional enzyme CysN/CysC